MSELSKNDAVHVPIGSPSASSNHVCDGFKSLLGPDECQNSWIKLAGFLRFLSLWHSCVIIFSFVYLGFLDWSILAALYASCYWHLLNVYYLGFNPLTLVGLILAFVVVPSILRIPGLQQIGSTPRGRLVESLSSCLFIAAGLQVQETARTIFLALAMGLSCNRFSQRLVVPSEPLSLSGGLFLLLTIRSLCWSLHPFDLMGSWIIPAVLLFVGVLCSLAVSFEEHRLSEICPKVSDNYEMSWRWDVPNGCRLRVLYGICSTILLSTVLFLIATILTSDAVIPRWSNFEPVSFGFVITLIVGLGWLFQTFIRYGPFIPTRYSTGVRMGIIVITLTVFTTGGALFIAFRQSVNSVSFIGGCLLSFTLPTILDVAINSYKNINTIATPLCGWLMSLLFGLWMLGGFAVSVAWFAGPMVPLIGNAFWGNELAIWCGSFVPAVVAFAVLLSICWAYGNRANEGSKMTASPGHCSSRPRSSKKMEVSSHNNIALSVFVVWILIMSCLYLPSLRSRIYFYVQRGSRAVTPLFTAATFNIQEGYSLPNKINPGFPTANRIVDLDSKLTPNVWGLQESDSTNILNMNRDWVSYLADSMRAHSFHGAPSWLPTPGVALLTTDKLINPTFQTLPRGDEPLDRLVSWGIYPWRMSPQSQILSEIIVATTHMSAFNGEARQLQLTAISNMIQNEWSNYPVVLLGDFNNNPVNTTKIWTDEDPLPSNSLRLVHNEAPTETAGFQNIDHIYFRGLCLREFGVSNTWGVSDHLPVWAKFELPKTAGTEICP